MESEPSLAGVPVDLRKEGEQHHGGKWGSYVWLETHHGPGGLMITPILLGKERALLIIPLCHKWEQLETLAPRAEWSRWNYSPPPSFCVVAAVGQAHRRRSAWIFWALSNRMSDLQAGSDLHTKSAVSRVPDWPPPLTQGWGHSVAVVAEPGLELASLDSYGPSLLLLCNSATCGSLNS